MFYKNVFSATFYQLEDKLVKQWFISDPVNWLLYYAQTSNLKSSMSQKE